MVYIHIQNRKSIKSESVGCLKNTYITFLTDKKKNLSNSSFCFAFDTCAQPHWKCAHVCVYMQVHMHTQTGTTHTHRHTWTNRNYTHGHTQTHHHRHNALTPVQVKSSAEEWLHSAEQCYKPGLCSSAIAACGHLFLWSPFCFQTAGWMMLCSHSTGCWQEDKMHAIMFQVTWDRVGKTNVIILMM